MSEIVLSNSNIAETVRLMDTDALRAELTKALAITAEQLAYLAYIWKELEARGEDLSDLRAGLARYLPRIASGHLDSGAVVKFAGHRTLLEAVSTLNVGDQRRLADGGTVMMVLPDSDGELREMEKPVYALSAAQVRQVFDVARMRSVKEQIELIQMQKSALANRLAPTKSKKIRVDTKTGNLRIGQTQLSPAEIIEALVGVYGEDVELPEGDGAKAIATPFTDRERLSLRINAAKAGITQQMLIRISLHSLGLLHSSE